MAEVPPDPAVEGDLLLPGEKAVLPQQPVGRGELMAGDEEVGVGLGALDLGRIPAAGLERHPLEEQAGDAGPGEEARLRRTFSR